MDELRQIVEEQIDRDHPSVALTPAAEAVVRRAIEEAAQAEERSIASDHVLVALAGEAEGSVAIALEKLAISQSAIRRQIAVLLSPPPEDEPS